LWLLVRRHSKSGCQGTDAHQFESTSATSSLSLSHQQQCSPLPLFERIHTLLVVVPVRTHREIHLPHCHLSLSLNYHPIATIDSSNHSSPTRDLLPSSTTSESALELATITNRTPQTTPLSPPQRVSTDSAVLSLVPATRSRSELEQGSSTDLLSSSISLGIVFYLPSLFNS